MERVGEVTRVTGDQLEITFCRPEDCEKCHACEGGQESVVLTLRGTAEVGDYACVALPTGTVVKASLLAYALPVAGLFGGMGLGAALFPDAMALQALTGAAGLLLCLGGVWLTERRRRDSAAWQPLLVRILPRAAYGAKPDGAPPSQ